MDTTEITAIEEIEVRFHRISHPERQRHLHKLLRTDIARVHKFHSFLIFTDRQYLYLNREIDFNAWCKFLRYFTKTFGNRYQAINE